MFEGIINFFKKIGKTDKEQVKSKDAAKERLHLVLMQDRANVSADFLDLMKQEIIEVIKKYIDVDENSIDVRLTNKANSDGTTGAPALYANIPIVSIKEEVKDKMSRQSKDSEKKSDNCAKTEMNIQKDTPVIETKSNSDELKEKTEKDKSITQQEVDKSNTDKKEDVVSVTNNKEKQIDNASNKNNNNANQKVNNKEHKNKKGKNRK